jgi:hypothetical protein
VLEEEVNNIENRLDSIENPVATGREKILWNFQSFA